METKTGKKRPASIDCEFYVPTKHYCTALDDFELFKKDSLHPRFEARNNQVKKITNSKPAISFSYTKGSGDNNPCERANGGLTSKTGSDLKDADAEKLDIDSYRLSKGLETDRRRIVNDINGRPKIDQRNTYHKIRRLLKFSSSDRRVTRSDDEEDEGYASKTSSAETQHESNLDEVSNLESQKIMSNSMMNLSELPSNSNGMVYPQNSLQNPYLFRESTRFKFNYTHQPPILQLPDPDMKMVNERIQVVRRLETEDSGLTLAKLKKSKEFNKCFPQEPEIHLHDTSLPADIHDDDSALNSDPIKPMTLVLRKISIQNNDQNGNTTDSPVMWSSVDIRSSRINSAAGSGNGSVKSPVGSSRSRKGSAVSRCGSAASQTSAVLSPTNSQPRSIRRSMTFNNIFGEPANLCAKNATWTQQFSLTERQATSYCIGDLLPAVDRNIYSSVYSNGKLAYPPFRKDDVPRDLSGNVRSASVEDGHMLLRKGMDLLTGNMDKPTLGPPPFRPNQSRHPLMRNATVVCTSNCDMPVQQERGKQSSFRATSEKGLRPTQLADKESQRKLKEAFVQFYKNRPQDIGREFRRVQTMWRS